MIWNTAPFRARGKKRTIIRRLSIPGLTIYMSAPETDCLLSSSSVGHVLFSHCTENSAEVTANMLNIPPSLVLRSLPPERTIFGATRKAFLVDRRRLCLCLPDFQLKWEAGKSTLNFVTHQLCNSITIQFVFEDRQDVATNFVINAITPSGFRMLGEERGKEVMANLNTEQRHDLVISVRWGCKSCFSKRY